MTDTTHGGEPAAEASTLCRDKEHRVRVRAYQIWEEEERPEGRDLDHWLRAKWELEQISDPDRDRKRLEQEFGLLREPG